MNTERISVVVSKGGARLWMLGGAMFAASMLWVPAHAEVPPSSAPTAPKYQSLRYEEDWSVLRQGSTGDPFDPFKYMPLTADGKVKGVFRATGIRPKFYERLVACGIELPVSTFNTSVEIG